MLDPTAPWDPAKGNYTRYGTVSRLLARTDDLLVAMAPGNELPVSFDAEHLPPVEPGWRRALFLELDGWAKDGEPNTVDGNRSEPLPFRKMKRYPYDQSAAPPSLTYQQYLRRYQTRHGYRLLPPLARNTG